MCQGTVRGTGRGATKCTVSRKSDATCYSSPALERMSASGLVEHSRSYHHNASTSGDQCGEAVEHEGRKKQKEGLKEAHSQNAEVKPSPRGQRKRLDSETSSSTLLQCDLAPESCHRGYSGSTWECECCRSGRGKMSSSAHGHTRSDPFLLLLPAQRTQRLFKSSHHCDSTRLPVLR
jgi:hypothetical protein